MQQWSKEQSLSQLSGLCKGIIKTEKGYKRVFPTYRLLKKGALLGVIAEAVQEKLWTNFLEYLRNSWGYRWCWRNPHTCCLHSSLPLLHFAVYVQPAPPSELCQRSRFICSILTYSCLFPLWLQEAKNTKTRKQTQQGDYTPNSRAHTLPQGKQHPLKTATGATSAGCCFNRIDLLLL